MSDFLIGIPGKLKTVLDRLTSARASNLDEISSTRMARLDVDVSSRQSESDALSRFNSLNGKASGLKTQVFTTSGTWTRPAGVDIVFATAIGGGGGGGGSTGSGYDDGSFGQNGGNTEIGSLKAYGGYRGAAGGSVSGDGEMGVGGATSLHGNLYYTTLQYSQYANAAAPHVLPTAMRGGPWDTMNMTTSMPQHPDWVGEKSSVIPGYGEGGNGGTVAYFSGGAGGNGGVIIRHPLVVTGDLSITIGAGGAGGAGGTNGFDGADGTDGVVIVEWYE